MATKTWSLYASDGPFQYQRFGLDEMPELMACTRRLLGGISDGVDVLTINSGPLEINLIPTRGMGIWNMSHEGETIGWKSPVAGPVHPKFVNHADPSGLGWLDGFDEFVVRCGLESNGAPEFNNQGSLRYPLHGKIANRPAKEVLITIDTEQESLTVVGVVEETRFHFAKLRLTSRLTLRKGDTGFELVDSIENLSGQASTCQLLYHINLGEPLLDAGSQVVAPLEVLVPRTDAAAEQVAKWNSMPPAGTNGGELVYFMKLLQNEAGKSPVLMHNSEGSKGVQISYDAKTLPCFTLWKNPVPPADGYVMGLEPATNYPNPRSFEEEQGRVVPLEPGASVDMKLRIDYLANSDAVESAVNAISQLQAQTTPEVHANAPSGWTAE